VVVVSVTAWVANMRRAAMTATYYVAAEGLGVRVHCGWTEASMMHTWMHGEVDGVIGKVRSAAMSGEMWCPVNGHVWCPVMNGEVWCPTMHSEVSALEMPAGENVAVVMSEPRMVAVVNSAQRRRVA
jgi:hypothetical protein